MDLADASSTCELSGPGPAAREILRPIVFSVVNVDMARNPEVPARVVKALEDLIRVWGLPVKQPS